MGCERCGGRMVSRSGDGTGLVCSDCGTAVHRERSSHTPHPAGSAGMLIGVAAFSALLFVLTNWHPRPPVRTAGRGMLQQVTTGAFVREPELLEKGSSSTEE
jgi:hypothetical protein